MSARTIISFMCAFCGVTNEVECDMGGRTHLSLHEDCWVCCRTNLVRVTLDLDTNELTAEAEDDS